MKGLIALTRMRGIRTRSQSASRRFDTKGAVEHSYRSLWSAYKQYAPANVPNSIYEFQGGAFDGQCSHFWYRTSTFDPLSRLGWLRIRHLCRANESRVRAGVLQAPVRAIDGDAQPPHDIRRRVLASESYISCLNWREPQAQAGVICPIRLRTLLMTS
jgi:hypothetical protein